MNRRPTIVFTLLTFGAAIALTVPVRRYVPQIGLLLAWLVAVNAVTFLTYGYDKAVAGSGRTRVPEAVLLALTLVGGTAGALAAQSVFRHKTRKKSYRRKLWLVVLAQLVLLIAYGLWVQGFLARR